MVERINTSKFMQAASQQQQNMLKVGQIMYGKIIQIFPNDMAEIMLNGRKMTAQLNTPLSIGDKRYFQVTDNRDVPQLKIFGDKATGQTGLDAANILQTLGMQPGKMNKAFLVYLMQQGVTFTKTQLRNALQLYSTVEDKTQARQIISAMITRSLPMTRDVYQALQTKSEHSLTSVLQSFLTELENSDSPKALIKELLFLGSRLLKDNHVSTAPLLTEQLSSRTEQLQRMVALLMQREMPEAVQTSRISIEKHVDAIFQSMTASVKSTSALIEYISTNKTGIQKESAQFVNRWEAVIYKAFANEQTLPEPVVQLFQKQVDRLMATVIGTSCKQRTESNSLTKMVGFLVFAKGLQHNDLFSMVSYEYTKTMNKNVSLQNQFLQHVTQVLNSLGIEHEYTVAHQETPTAMAATIKSLVLQLMQSTDSLGKDSAEKLLQYINGMQLDSVQEVNNQLFTSLQIPGGRLGLPQDMELRIAGKKRPDGKIDKEFCHILFYLHLTALQETVVDMHVQKRSVRITVFNNHKHLPSIAERLKPKLAEELKSRDYHLSSIHFKMLTQREKALQRNSDENNSPFLQAKGVDFRI
ncbi:hypothetical protein ACFSMW_03710 [Virgibacillus halophilus]|uniref:Hook-length control protein FliK n=1 Tax=Tigheibacillus halophilus TaxID=361280 RepID=A0ABU5CAH9_9BACI|nr:hypothetical protein [Virgibacillus halophilus]